jgi:hypothetical protein
MHRRAVNLLLVAGCLGLALSPARSARGDAADPALTPLLDRAGVHATRFEEMRKRGSYTLAGHMDEVSSTGAVSANKDMVVRVTATGDDTPLIDVVRYTENGADKTADAQQKALARRAKKKRARANDFHLPFHPSQRSRYTFARAERDAATRAVRVTFTPKEAALDAIKGSAWLDEASGEVLSMGFSFSKNPRFVDHVDVKLVFGLTTPLGRAPSELTFDAEGGLLFVHKHFRGFAKITEARVTR